MLLEAMRKALRKYVFALNFPLTRISSILTFLLTSGAISQLSQLLSPWGVILVLPQILIRHFQVVYFLQVDMELFPLTPRCSRPSFPVHHV